MNRRGFLARLFAAPIVALALLKAPTVTEWEPLAVTIVEPFGVDFGWDSADIAFGPEWDDAFARAARVMADEMDRRCSEYVMSMHT